jgi:hypothetical protein
VKTTGSSLNFEFGLRSPGFESDSDLNRQEKKIQTLPIEFIE